MHLAIVVFTEEKNVDFSGKTQTICLVMFLGLLEDAVKKINQYRELKEGGQKE